MGRLTFLVDTNVWLETLLDQANAREASDFLKGTSAERLFLTEFSLYSIGLILVRLGKADAFQVFVTDTLIESGVKRIRLDEAGLLEVARLHKERRLDFDDAYQCVAAQRHGLVLVSFDRDFDKAGIRRISPRDAVKD